ncbi:MAG: 2'-5' RNA ligase family protein [Thaumarchaeota archaeon]|nr:2'-5' RNA ligase family protein [Nitrososphaerota archaeon]
MTYDYLIEIRPIIEKYRLKGKTTSLKHKLGLRKTTRVPHLTLVYNFIPKIPAYKIAELIKETASKYKELRFTYCDLDLKEGDRGHTLVFRIEPSEELREFRYELYQKLKNSIIENPRTKKFNAVSKNDFWFHAAIAIHQDDKKAEKIDDFIENKETLLEKFLGYFRDNEDKHTSHTRRSLVYPSEAARITILRSGKIAYEYDKFINKILGRSESLSWNYKRLTLEAYRKKKQIEFMPTNVKDSAGENWLISDTHFGHSNIIDLCARPFVDVKEMNNILENNWNATVKKEDTVYFLGDITLGRGARPKDYWLSKLNGNIVYIRGNHDKEIEHTKLSETVDYKGYRFLLIHDPSEKPKEWNDWVIHGDKHNNNLGKYPLINRDQKTVNVCVELIKYRPINFDKIIEMIENKKDGNVLTLDYECNCNSSTKQYSNQ